MSYLKCSSEKCNLGDSKFFGCPDLPDDFDWPVDFDGYDMEFICQIDCESASEFCPELPKTGHLYFFGCIAYCLGELDAPELTAGKQPDGFFKVCYSPVPTGDLLEGEIVDEDGNAVGFSPLKIEFTENVDECVDAFHSCLDDEKQTEDGKKVLLCVDSFTGEDFELSFGKSGYLFFEIADDDLENENFDNIICEIVEE